MAKMFDYLPDSLRKDTVNIGDIFKCFIPAANKHKLFTVVAFNGDDIVGSMLINSEVNKNVHRTEESLNHQLELLEVDYDFLSWNSHVDCTQLIGIMKNRILAEINSDVDSRYLGKLDLDDIQAIKRIVIKSRIISKKEKRVYGFID